MSGIMTKIEVFKAGGKYVTDKEKQLRRELSGCSLDGLAATAIFGGVKRSLSPTITSL